MKLTPLISILMPTYNHEKYIAQAIKSALMQKTDFEWELLIHDDCSTDSTLSVARSYSEKHPDKIKLLTETKNQVCRHVDPRSVFRQKRQPIRRNIALRKIILRKNTIRFASFFWNFPGNDFDFCFLSALSRAVLFALIQQTRRCGNGRKKRFARRPKFGKRSRPPSVLLLRWRHGMYR